MKRKLVVKPKVCSRALGVPIERINSTPTSTDTVANTIVTAGSSGADNNGPAIMRACEQILQRLKPIREANPDDTWEQLIEKAYAERVNLSAFGFTDVAEVNFDFQNNKGHCFEYFTFGAGVVEVC